MNKNYYALEQTNGHISVYSSYGAPILHVFDNKKERDDFVNNYDPCDINHSADVTTAKIAYSAYSNIVDGGREWGNRVVFH